MTGTPGAASSNPQPAPATMLGGASAVQAAQSVTNVAQAVAVRSSTPAAGDAPKVAQVQDRFDIRHTELDDQAGQVSIRQPEEAVNLLASQDALPTSSPAASISAAIPQDNQQSMDRNVATERSTTVSLGSVLTGSSNVSKEAESGMGDGGRPRQQGDRSTPDRAAAPSPRPETTGVVPSSGLSQIAASGKPTAAEVSPASQPHDRLRVVEQVTQKLDTMRLTSGRQEVTIHLRPDSLGDLRLTVVADRQEIVAKVVAETAAARDAVHEGREQLRASLEQKGYSLQGLDVSLGGGGQQRFAGFEQPRPQPIDLGVASRPQREAPAAAVAPASNHGPVRRSAGRLDYQA
jgi:flagellar hook-length control protein FliK